MEEGKKEFIEEWNYSAENTNLTKKRNRNKLKQLIKPITNKPEIILNNIAEMTKDEKRKCISKFLYS